MNKKQVFITFLFTIILCCFFCACGNISEDLTDNTSNATKESTSGKSSGNTKNDKIISVVDSYLKAIVERNPEKVDLYCTTSLIKKKKIYKTIKQLDKTVKTSESDLMNNFINYAQKVFFNAANNDDDLIDARYLQDDDDVKKAISEYVEFICCSSIIYSLPKKAKIISDKEATVKVKLYTKDIAEVETSTWDYVKTYLENTVISKFVEDSNFIKEQIAKKIMKEALIESLNSLRKDVEETAEETFEKTAIYHLKKKKGSWIITKID